MHPSCLFTSPVIMVPSLSEDPQSLGQSLKILLKNDICSHVAWIEIDSSHHLTLLLNKGFDEFLLTLRSSYFSVPGFLASLAFLLTFFEQENHYTMGAKRARNTHVRENLCIEEQLCMVKALATKCSHSHRWSMFLVSSHLITE